MFQKEYIRVDEAASKYEQRHSLVVILNNIFVQKYIRPFFFFGT